MSDGGFSAAGLFNDLDDDGLNTEPSVANSAAATFASSHARFTALGSVTEDGEGSPGSSTSASLKQLQTQKALMEINFEQRCHEFEVQNRDLMKEMDEWKLKAERYRKELQDSESAMDTLRTEYRNVKSTNENLHAELSQLRRSISTIDTAKRTALENLLNKESEVDQLNDKCRELTESLNLLKSEQTKSESSVFDLQSQERNLKFQVTKLEQELALARQQNEWLDREIKQKCEEFAGYRNEKSNQTFRLQTELESTTGELRAAEATINQLQTRVADLTSQLDQINSKLQDTQNASILTEEGLRQELTTQKKLAEALRKSDADKSDKLKKLGAEFSEIENRISGKTSEVNRVLEEKNAELTQIRTDLEEKEAENERLRTRVNIADELLASRGLSFSPSSNKKGNSSDATAKNVSPAASALTSIQKSGKTFTEIYSDYVDAQNEIARLRSENEQIKQGMNDMLQEVQARASHYGQLETAYEAIVREANDLSTQLEQVLQDRQDLGFQLTEMKKEAKQLQEDNRWARQLNKDLTTQLQSALFEVEELRGNIPQGEPISELQSAEEDEELGAQAVISERLVAFHNIQELVNKNQEMLLLTRKLSDKSENDEMAKRDSEINALKQKYAEAMNQLRALAEERRKNEVLVQSLINERDMYRRVAQEPNRRTPLPVQSSPFPDVSVFEPSIAARSPSPGSLVPMSVNQHQSQQQLESYQKMVSDLQNNFEAYRVETTQDQKVLQQQLSASQKEAADFRVKAAQLGTQVQFLQDRVNILNDTNDQQTKELNELRSRQSSLLANLAQFESKMKDSEQEKATIRDELSRARLSLSHLQSEKDLMRTSEVRYQEEQKMLLQERERLNQLIHHLQTIHGDLEKSELDARRQLEQEKSNLKSELSKLRDHVAESSAEIKGLTVRKDTEIREWQIKYEKQLAEVQKVREQLTPLEAKLAGTEERVKILQDTLKQKEEEIRQIRVRGALVQRLAATTPVKGEMTEKSSIVEADIDAAERELHARERHLETEIQQIRRDLEETKADAERQRKHAETYMEIAKSAEEKLASNNEAYELYKTTTDTQLKELATENENLKMQSDALNTNLEITVKESERNIGELASAKRDLEARVEELSENNRRLTIDADEAIRNQEVLRQDMQRQRRIAQEATINYEAELVKHGRNIEQVTELRAQLLSSESRNNSLKLELELAKDELNDSRKSWEEQKSILTNQDIELESRIKELKSQNDILHAQLETLAGQLSKLHKVPEYHLTDLSNATEGGEAFSTEQKTIDELREVVRFLRREKEILEFDREANSQEIRRLQQQLDFVNRALEENRLQLSEERHRTGHGKFISEDEYAEWKEKCNQLEVIRESNTTLREENNRNKARAAKLESQVKQLLSELDPLKENVLSLKAELEARQIEIKNLEEDNARWKNRIQQILAKYDKIDPEEHKLLAESYEKAAADLEQAQARVAEFELSAQQQTDKAGKALKAAEHWKSKCEQFEQNLRAANEKLQALKEQEGLAEKLHVTETEATALRERLVALETQNKSLAEKCDKVNTAGIKWRNRATVAEATLKEMKEKEEAGEQVAETALQEKVKTLEAEHNSKLVELEEKRKRDVEAGRQEVIMRQKLKDAMAEKKIKTLETQNQQLQSQIDSLTNQIKQVEQNIAAATTENFTAAIDNLVAPAERSREESLKRSAESPQAQPSVAQTSPHSILGSPLKKKAKFITTETPTTNTTDSEPVGTVTIEPPSWQTTESEPAQNNQEEGTVESAEEVINYEVEEAPEEDSESEIETPAPEDISAAALAEHEAAMEFIETGEDEEEQISEPFVEEPEEHDQQHEEDYQEAQGEDAQMNEAEIEAVDEGEESDAILERGTDEEAADDAVEESYADDFEPEVEGGEEEIGAVAVQEELLAENSEVKQLQELPVITATVISSKVSPIPSATSPPSKPVIVTSSGAVIPKITFEPAPSGAPAKKPAAAVAPVAVTPQPVKPAQPTTPGASKSARQKAARLAAAAAATRGGGITALRGGLTGARGALRGAAAALQSIGAGRGGRGQRGRGAGKSGRDGGAAQGGPTQ